MIISRSYQAQSLERSFYQSIDLFLFGTVTDEERNRHFFELWGSKAEPKSYHIDYNLDTEEYSLVAVPFGSTPSRIKAEKARMDITAHLRNQLNEIGVRDSNLLVDITGISQPAIFFLLKVLHEDLWPARLFFAYTEPYRYRAKYWPSSEDVFELTERFIGLKALPGFLKKPARDRRLMVVLLIGFEGKRAKYVCETLEVSSDDIRVVLGLPGFRPGWQYLAYGSNQSMFEYFQAYRFLWMAAANNPFEAYNAVDDIRINLIKSGLSDFEIAVAPIGTKPHAVGASIFALHQPVIARLVYDFPVKARRYRSEGYGATWIYNLTELVCGRDVHKTNA